MKVSTGLLLVQLVRLNGAARWMRRATELVPERIKLSRKAAAAAVFEGGSLARPT